MKSRFCPSPTGYIHLGNARTALFNYLAAQSASGCFLLRIEDTDKERSKTEYVDALEEDLCWLGLNWQEGPNVGGKHAPYFQSARADVYAHYYKILQDKGVAYPCFCSEEQLALARKIQRAQGQAPRYSGTCRNLTDCEIKEKIAQGQKAVLRFHVPKEETISFQDVVRGEQQFNTQDIGDFIIRRGDGGSSFMFCNAIDDALMGVNMAMRGEDHLTNTPRQLMILKALDLPLPHYAHISLIVGQDGTPLSKRHGSKSIRELRALGYLPLAVVNYLARLGHTYENPDFMLMSELCTEFNCDHLGKAPAKFDPKQLEHFQKIAVMQLEESALMDWLAEVLKTVPKAKQKEFLTVIQPNIHFPAEAAAWARLLFDDTLVFSDAAIGVANQAGKLFFETLLKAIELHTNDYAAITGCLKETLSVKGKGLFQPLRVALTGQLHGPELAPMLRLIGRKAALERINQLIGQLSS